MEAGFRESDYIFIEIGDCVGSSDRSFARQHWMVVCRMTLVRKRAKVERIKL